MSPQIVVPTRLIEAPDDGSGGPRWVAKLNNGTRIVGRPSWMSSGPNVALPYTGATDWQRLMARLRENAHERVVGLSLWVPPWGFFPAEDNQAGYGYFETMVASQRQLTPQTRTTNNGISALGLCWGNRDGEVVTIKVYAGGDLEKWVRTKWLPCMVGDQVVESGVKTNDKGTPADYSPTEVRLQ